MKGLEEQLGAPAPAGLSRLSQAQRDDLARAIADARHRQAAELASASEKALGHIPRLLRTAIQRVLG